MTEIVMEEDILLKDITEKIVEEIVAENEAKKETTTEMVLEIITIEEEITVNILAGEEIIQQVGTVEKTKQTKQTTLDTYIQYVGN